MRLNTYSSTTQDKEARTMGAILTFERCPYAAERITNVFRSVGHRVHVSSPLGVNPTARLVAKIRPVVVTTCWQRSDQYTIAGVRRVSKAPIWIITDEPEEEVAAIVGDAQFIIPKSYPEVLRKIILRELGMGADA